ncbi:MAG TPA: hypothetical protein DCM28_16245 [Phycisphaerales bacterium]|nr:hypothetical protein [Phycisphaerales bacterium]HCD33366.1 hypothetical protein [Phycisphaerales bacterium]|tara:strand:- start:887 stop:1333 length:447 start_codon:yes stop_codon:yes gene_type:complete
MSISRARLSMTFMLVLLMASISVSHAQASENPGSVVPVKIADTSGLYISHSRARLQDQQLLVTGTVRRTRLFPADVHGYVQITAYDANGLLLAQKYATYSQTLLIVEGLRRATFSMELPISSAIPTQVSVQTIRGKITNRPDDSATDG